MNAFTRLSLKVEKKIIDGLKLIKRALATESRETTFMLKTYVKFTSGEASQIEMERANKQFRSFLKTIGLGVFAVLPFAPITIPTIVKLGERFGVDILPSSFRSQKEEEAKKPPQV